MEFTPPQEHQENTQKVTNTKPYCRLCLKPALKNQMVCLGDFHDINYPSRTQQFKRNKILQTEMYVKMVKYLMPNFDHKLIFNPVMCPKCSIRLQKAHEFVEQCMSNQNAIQRYKELFTSTNKTISCEEVAKNQWKIDSLSAIKNNQPSNLNKLYPSKKIKVAETTENIIETAPVQIEETLVTIKTEEIKTANNINSSYIKIEPHDLVKQEETCSKRIINVKTEVDIKNEQSLIDKSDILTNHSSITTPNTINANAMVRLAPVQYCQTTVPIQFVQPVSHNYLNMLNPLTGNYNISTNGNLPVMPNNGFSLVSSNVDLPNNQM